MCCELCPEFEECEDSFEGSEYCCLKCPEYEDCPSRLELDYDNFGDDDDTEEAEF
jgi:hypothetical protein